MMYGMELNYDFEALRKNMKVHSFCSLLLNEPLSFGGCISVDDATPEELLAMARSRGINIDNYKLKKGETVEVRKKKRFFWNR